MLEKVAQQSPQKHHSWLTIISFCYPQAHRGACGCRKMSAKVPLGQQRLWKRKKDDRSNPKWVSYQRSVIRNNHMRTTQNSSVKNMHDAICMQVVSTSAKSWSVEALSDTQCAQINVRSQENLLACGFSLCVCEFKNLEQQLNILHIKTWSMVCS